MKKNLQTAAGALLSLLMCTQSFALGTASYSSELVSTRSLGQGATGVAGTQNDPFVVYTNPAAMTDLKGTQATLALTYVNSDASFTSGVTSPGGLAGNYTQASQGSVTGARATSVFVPDFAVTTQFLDGKLSAGFAVAAPYGSETHFDGDSPLRYAATDTRLRIIDITPSVAYKVCDGFSFGAGADYYDTVEGDLEKKVNVSALNTKFSQFGSFADANSSLTGNGGGWGYHLGTTFRPNEHHQIGLVYHSNVKMSLTGNYNLTGLSGNSAAVLGTNISASITAPVYIPQNVQLGYSFMPNDKWNIEADVAWYDWYAARSLGVVYSGLTSAQSSVLNSPSSNPQTFNGRDTVNFGVGANYKQSDSLQLRGGAYYEAASLPETDFDPAFIDLPRYALAIGGSYAFTKNLGLDAAYNAVFLHGRSVNAPSSGGSGYDGNFNNFISVLSASLSYRTDMHL